MKRSRYLLQSLVVLLSIATVLMMNTAFASPTPNPGCTPNVVPVGQANPPGSQLEPLAPIWCFNLNPANPPDAVIGANDWTDDFHGVAQDGQFNDGDYGYRQFAMDCPDFTQKYFTNNQHWMQDLSLAGGNTNCSTFLRPNRSFHFENGKLVVEQDVAAAISGYDDNGDSNFAEIDVSMGSQPTGAVVDSLYGYGHFGGFWTVGCRLHPGRNLICSVENASGGVVVPLQPSTNCNQAPPSRILEISGFEVCGSTHSGGDPFGDNANFWRTCDSGAEEPDMMCRDRFRMEITQNSLTVYVNGHMYFQDAGWPVGHQIDPAAIANGQWYVYDVNWLALAKQPAYRFHWDNFTVNPHNADGTFRAPTAAPNFCLGDPMNTCSEATPVPTRTAPPTSTPTATVVPPTSTPTPLPTTTSTVPPCQVMVVINGQASLVSRPASFCTNQ